MKHPQDGQHPDRLDDLDSRATHRAEPGLHEGAHRDTDRPYATDTDPTVDGRDRLDADHGRDLDRRGLDRDDRRGMDRDHGRHDGDAVREPGRGKAILAGLLLVLGGALLMTELATFTDGDASTGGGLDSLMGTMGRILLPVLGLVLMLIAFMVRKSKATILLLLLGALSLITAEGARLFGDQSGQQAGAGDLPETLMIAGVIATALTGLLTIAHGIVMFFRRNHVTRAERRALARQRAA